LINFGDIPIRAPEAISQLPAATAPGPSIMQRRRPAEIDEDITEVGYRLNIEESDSPRTPDRVAALGRLQGEAAAGGHDKQAARGTRALTDLQDAFAAEGKPPGYAGVDAALVAAATALSAAVARQAGVEADAVRQALGSPAAFNAGVLVADDIRMRADALAIDLARPELAGLSSPGLMNVLGLLGRVGETLGLMAFAQQQFDAVRKALDVVWATLLANGDTLLAGRPGGSRKNRQVRIAQGRYDASLEETTKALTALAKATEAAASTKDAGVRGLDLEHDKRVLSGAIGQATANAGAREILARAVGALNMSSASVFTEVEKGYPEATILEACRAWDTMGRQVGNQLKVTTNLHVPGGWQDIPWKQRGQYLERTKNLIANVRGSACNVHVHPTGGWRRKR